MASSRLLISALFSVALLMGCTSAAPPQGQPSTQLPGPLVPTRSIYAPVKRTPDGIGKAYQDREIAGVMGWQGAKWLEREEREREENTTLLLKELAITPGMAVADIGAGTGYISRRLSTAVGPDGAVFAVDVQPQMVAMLKRVAVRPEFANIVPVLGGERSPNLAPASVDLAVMVDVYHELEYPAEMLDAIVGALKPGGRVAFVEYRGEDASVPIKALHKMTQAQVKREAALHHLDWQRTAETLPWQHVVIFRRSR